MKKASLFLFLLCLSTSAFAQSKTAITGQNYWGFDLGIDNSIYVGNNNFLWHVENGTFDPVTMDPNNDIQSYIPLTNMGSGLGFLVGGKVAFALSSGFDLATKIRYLTNHTSTEETQQVTLARDPFTGHVTDSAQATNTYKLTLSNLSIAELLNIRLTDQLYGIAGLEFSDLLSNSLELHQTLQNGKSYYYNGTGDLSGGTSLDHPAAAEDAYFNKSRFAFQFGLGSAAALSSSTLLDAELLISVPFTNWLTQPAMDHLDSIATLAGQPAISYPKLWYASLTIGIRFPFEFGGGGSAYADNGSENTSTTHPNETHAEIDAEGKVPLTGRVSDNSGKAVDANITVVDLTSNEVVATDKTGSDGRYSVRVKAPGKYSVTADADGYLFGTAYFEVDKDGRILSSHPDIKLSETTNGRTRLLVFFDFSSSDLKSSSYPELNRAVKLMKAVPTMQVEIAGYTDSVGSEQVNKALSERRANAVKDYLVKNGIAKKRVAAKGYGEESPIADNGTDEGRAENRRVEFVVLSK